jgi:hypothetical protein
MWIKQIRKTNTPKGKVFFQYQLTQTMRIDRKVKHKAILYLGYDPLLNDKKNRQVVSKLLQYRIMNQAQLPEMGGQVNVDLEQLADKYYDKYLIKHQIEPTSAKPKTPADKTTYEQVDISTTEVFNAREIGAEWLCYKVAEHLDIRGFLKRQGWRDKWIEHGLISIISRAVFASSEHKTEHWLHHNSGLLELFSPAVATITRHHLYKAASRLYDAKANMEPWLSDKTTELFNLDDSLVIYDLTNTYFEGRKVNSTIARYGKSKEKRNDCKQVVLAAVINRYGFLKHSQIYEGNMADKNTLADIIEQLQKKSPQTSTSQTIVIDAGIATEDNLALLKEKQLRYVCVSRKKLKDYEALVDQKTISIQDKRKNTIELKLIPQQDESWLYVKSEMKQKKENAMHQQAIARFEQELENVKQGIAKPRGTKMIEKVWERIGRIKERNTSAHKYFDINITEEKGIATLINWKKNELKEEKKQSGVYFIRTNYPATEEKQLWQIYNLIREVESTFRCLKTDLNLRPVFHKKDPYTEAHLNLGLLAYALVNTIRYMLGQQNIYYDWRNIVRIMNTQKITTIKQKGKNKEIAVRLCSRPTKEALQIYKAIGISSMPIAPRKSVVLH